MHAHIFTVTNVFTNIITFEKQKDCFLKWRLSKPMFSLDFLISHFILDRVLTPAATLSSSLCSFPNIGKGSGLTVIHSWKPTKSFLPGDSGLFFPLLCKYKKMTFPKRLLGIWHLQSQPQSFRLNSFQIYCPPWTLSIILLAHDLEAHTNHLDNTGLLLMLTVLTPKITTIHFSPLITSLVGIIFLKIFKFISKIKYLWKESNVKESIF